MRVGIAGFGVVGKKRKQCIDARSDMQCVAICDQELPAIPPEGPSVKLFDNYASLLDFPLDVLFVCLPNNLAAEVTIAGLERGLHVFCEKPPARNLTELQKVIDAETVHARQKLMFGFNHRYHDSVEDALAILNSDELGAVISLRGIYGKSKLITFNQPDWRTKRELAGGGVLLDQGIHLVDLMRLFAGEFTEVHSVISNGHWNYDVEDNAYALMRTDSGITAQLTSSATQWRHRFSLEITLEKGSIILGGILSGSKSYGAETLTVVYANPDLDNGDPREQATLYNSDRSWEREIEEFASVIKNETQVVRNGSRDAFHTLALVESIYYADERWRRKFDLKPPLSPLPGSQ